MEEDRLQTNLGPDIGADLESEVTATPKQPKRRFIGRRAAEKAIQSSSANESIEESGAVQGALTGFSVICPR
jgi:2-(3-amino-3-carboxypropyl)histidine synthase